MFAFRSKCALPLKWMAIESIERRTFNSSSDIWSFGIMMWELFSLGAVPYVNINDQSLLDQLLRGYRLKCPTFCSPAIYANILDCWKTVPTDRPRFSVLVDRLSNFLSKELLAVCDHFEPQGVFFVSVFICKIYTFL